MITLSHFNRYNRIPVLKPQCISPKFCGSPNLPTLNEDVFQSSTPHYDIEIKRGKKVPLNQANVWALYEDERFEKLIKSDEEVSKPVQPILNLLEQYKITPSLKLFIAEKIPGTNELIDNINSKYNVDLRQQPNVYRFVEKAEVDALLSKGEVKPQRYFNKFDVTTNPELDWNQYRITFKPSDKFSLLDDANSKINKNIGVGKEDYYYLEDEKYTKDDVLKIEKLTPEGLESIDFE